MSLKKVRSHGHMVIQSLDHEVSRTSIGVLGTFLYHGCSYFVIFILSYLKASYTFIGAVCHSNENKIQCFGALWKMLTCDDYHHVGLGQVSRRCPPSTLGWVKLICVYNPYPYVGLFQMVSKRAFMLPKKTFCTFRKFKVVLLGSLNYKTFCCLFRKDLHAFLGSCNVKNKG